MIHLSLSPRRRPLRTAGAAAATAVLVTLSACGYGPDPAAGTASGSSAPSLEVVDPWVTSADAGMTAAFGTLTNTGDEDLVVTGASSPDSPTVELHETVAGDGGMQMREKEGGFTVPAGGEVELAPGGNHLMLMDLRQPLRPGERVTVTLDLGGGATTEFDAVVKDFSGADEEYVPGHGS